MNRFKLISHLFQHGHRLTTSSSFYSRRLKQFFSWQIKADQVGDDITVSTLLSDSQNSPNFKSSQSLAKVVARRAGRISGIEEVIFFLERYTKLKKKESIKDGSKVLAGESILELAGAASEILRNERIILNFLSRMSGITTATAALVHSLPKRGSQLAATRKTPWMLLDKKAVFIGGGLTHRLTLADGILVKDNHIIAVQEKRGLANKQVAISSILKMILPPKHLPPPSLIEIEVESAAEAILVAHIYNQIKKLELSQPESRLVNHRRSRPVPIPLLVLMLDNFKLDKVKEIVSRIHKVSPTLLIEASGSITADKVRRWAKIGVDVISLGSLTHSTHALDMSMEWMP